MSTSWADSLPRGVMDPLCPSEHVIETKTDRRLLWHIESMLAVCAPTGSTLSELQRVIKSYLNDTCDHHWHDYAGDPDIGKHRQCLWCSDVQWGAES